MVAAAFVMHGRDASAAAVCSDLSGYWQGDCVVSDGGQTSTIDFEVEYYISPDCTYFQDTGMNAMGRLGSAFPIAQTTTTYVGSERYPSHINANLQYGWEAGQGALVAVVQSMLTKDQIVANNDPTVQTYFGTTITRSQLVDPNTMSYRMESAKQLGASGEMAKRSMNCSLARADAQKRGSSARTTTGDLLLRGIAQKAR
jgi:hypothetical protein